MTTVGCILLGLSLVCCMLGLAGRKQTVPDSYAASGRKGTFTTPEPPGGTIAVNFADAEELTALPGIGESMARAIIDEREQNGLFHYPEDLLSVRGIGEAKLSKIRPLLDMTAE